MAWQDRPYNREDLGASPLSGNGRYSVTLWLAGVNFVVFLFDQLLSGSMRISEASPFLWGYYSIGMALRHGQVWRFVTYQFLHLDFMHLFGNLLGLIFFGPLMESYFGSRRFLAFYLLCGTSGAMLFTLGALFPWLLGPWAEMPLVGASGSIFGILIGSALVAPMTPVGLMFLPITMTMRTIAWVYLGFAALSLLFGSRNSGGEAAHLGGAAMGWLLVKQPWLLNWAGSIGPRYAGPRAATAQEKKPNKIKQWLEQREEQAAVNLEKEVDRILAKVHDHGLQSLTEREKNTLSEATKKQQQRRGQ
jgi:membrane associated rhomboid family serine protease